MSEELSPSAERSHGLVPLSCIFHLTFESGSDIEPALLICDFFLNLIESNYKVIANDITCLTVKEPETILEVY